MAFTEKEKARIRHHLGYPSWQHMASAIHLGTPAGVEVLHLLEAAFNKMMPEGEEVIRVDLCNCEDIENQMAGARSRLKTEKVDKVTMNHGELGALRRELELWQRKLADDLGCFPNPFDLSHGAGGGINAKVC